MLRSPLVATVLCLIIFQDLSPLIHQMRCFPLINGVNVANITVILWIVTPSTHWFVWIVAFLISFNLEGVVDGINAKTIDTLIQPEPQDILEYRRSLKTIRIHLKFTHIHSFAYFGIPKIEIRLFFVELV